MMRKAALFFTILVSVAAHAEGINDQVVKQVLEFTVNNELRFLSSTLNKGLYREYSEYISFSQLQVGNVDRSLNSNECRLSATKKIGDISAGSKLFAKSALVQRQVRARKNEGDPHVYTDLVAVSLFSSLEKAAANENVVVYVECRIPVANFATYEGLRTAKIRLGQYDGELNLSELNRILSPFITVRPIY